VLRAKYWVTSGLPETIVRGRCSFLWRALAKVWPLIRENLLWSMGDGRNISDMVTNGGGWNLDLFQLWLPEELIKRIVGIPPSHATAETDKQLLTNTVRVHRGLRHNSVCGHISEDVIHAIRNFPTAQSIWNQLIPVEEHDSESGVCLNTEGSVRHDDGFAVVGGFVRDHDGKWLFKFNRYLGSYTVFDAELWGILDGLTCLVDRGYDNIIIQSNNLDVVKNIQEGLVEGTNSALVRIIHQMLLRLGH
ncbi:hypothetical protein Goari_000787, partial [Gossypium aridum]|nr:hypothetical protein [Gossypium aridum]